MKYFLKLWGRILLTISFFVAMGCITAGIFWILNSIPLLPAVVMMVILAAGAFAAVATLYNGGL